MNRPVGKRLFVYIALLAAAVALVLAGVDKKRKTLDAHLEEAPDAPKGDPSGCVEDCQQAWSQCIRECNVSRELGGTGGVCDVRCSVGKDQCRGRCGAPSGVSDEQVAFLLSARGVARAVAALKPYKGAALAPDSGTDAVGGDGVPTDAVCRELTRARLIRGCLVEGAPATAVKDIRRFVNNDGVVDGVVFAVKGSTAIDAIVAEIAQADAEGACRVLGSAESRLIAMLGRSMACSLAPRVRMALDRPGDQ
jgi:hypothetical protein